MRGIAGTLQCTHLKFGSRIDAQKSNYAASQKFCRGQWDCLVARSRAMRADGFVRNVASPAFDAVVHGNLADRPESFVIKSRYVKGGAQLLIKLAKILQMHSQSGQFYSIVGE